MALSVVSTRLSSLGVFAALFFCILHCTDPSLLGKMVLEGAGALLEDLGMPRRVGAEMGERDLKRGRWKEGLSLQVGWEARSFVEETGPRAVVQAVDPGVCQLHRKLNQGLVQFPHLAG